MLKRLSLDIIESDELDLSDFTVESFLASLSAPTVITFNPKQGATKTCRIITTLLHANEPSGFKAAFQMARDGFEPAITTYVILASTSAAKIQPVFSHRTLPKERDLNRCFNNYQQDTPGKIAKLITEFMIEKQPEAVIDLHNTSGSGPPYGVATHQTQSHQNLTSHFANRLIFTQMRLGTLMEQEFNFPIVTIEAGGAGDVEADVVARKGMESFMLCEHPCQSITEVEVLRNPHRFELARDKTLGYSHQYCSDYDITLRSDIEQFNSGITASGTVLGWTSETLATGFEIKNIDTEIDKYFYIEKREIKTKLPLKLFMATSRADIASSDCLLYFIA